jgi:hypothetical protein
LAARFSRPFAQEAAAAPIEKGGRYSRRPNDLSLLCTSDHSNIGQNPRQSPKLLLNLA